MITPFSDLVLAKRGVCCMLQFHPVCFTKATFKNKDTTTDSKPLSDNVRKLLKKAQQELSHEQIQNTKIASSIVSNEKWNVPSSFHESFSPIANVFHERKEEILSRLLFNQERFGMTYDQFLLEEAYNCGLEIEMPKVMEYEHNGGRKKVFELLLQDLHIHGRVTMALNRYLLEKGARKNRVRFKQKLKTEIAKNEQKLQPNEDSPTYVIRCVNRKKINAICRRNIYNAKMFGQPLVFDCRFDLTYNSRHTRCATQVRRSFQENKNFHDGFSFMFCNLPQNSFMLSFLKNQYHELDDIVTYTDKSYLCLGDDILPREKLIYLSPDAKVEMTEFQHDKIYIIGAMVDLPEKYNLTHSVAMSEKIQCQKLPITRYLKWGGTTNTLSLSVTTMVQILLTLKHTDGNWIEAFKNIPLKFHRGLTPHAKSMLKGDQDTITRFTYRPNLNKDKLQRSPIFSPKSELIKKYWKS